MTSLATPNFQLTAVKKTHTNNIRLGTFALLNPAVKTLILFPSAVIFVTIFCILLQRMGDSDSQRSLPSTIPKSALEDISPEAAGEQTPSPGDKLDPEYEEMLAVVNRIKMLRRQQKLLNTFINYEKERKQAANIPPDELVDIVTKMETEYLKKVREFDGKELSESRVKLTDTYGKLLDLHEEEETYPPLDIRPEIAERIRKMMIEEQKISDHVRKEMKEVSHLEEEVNKLSITLSEKSAKRHSVMKPAMERSELLQERKEEMVVEDNRMKRLTTRSETLVRHICTVNRIIESIVSECGVKWVEVDQYKKMLISVSKPIREQITECSSPGDASKDSLEDDDASEDSEDDDDAWEDSADDDVAESDRADRH